MHKRSRVFFGLLVGLLVVALGVAIRIIILIGQKEFVWLDELHTAWVVSGSFRDVMPRAMIGNQSPLFFWLEYLAVPRGSFSSIALRMPSVICGVALIPATAWVCWKITRNAYAVLAALSIVGLDYFFVFYATEARPFVFVQLTAVFQVFAFWMLHVARKAQHKNMWSCSFVLLSTIMFYLHYTSLLILIAEGLFVATSYLRLRYSRGEIAARHELTRFGIESTLIWLACSFGLWHLLKISQARGDWESFATADVFLGQILPMWICYFLLPLILIASIWLLQSWRNDEKKLLNVDFDQLLFFAMIVAIPFAMAAMVSGIRVGADAVCLAAIGNVRYVIASLAIAPLFVGVVVSCIDGRIGKLVAVSLVGLGVLVSNPSLMENLFNNRLAPLRTERWDLVRSQVNSSWRVTQEYPVFVCPNLVEDERLNDDGANSEFCEYCQFALDNNLYPLKPQDRQLFAVPTLIDSRFKSIHLDSAIRGGGVFIIVRGSMEIVDAIKRDLALALRDRGFAVKFFYVFQPVDSDVLVTEARIYHLDDLKPQTSSKPGQPPAVR